VRNEPKDTYKSYHLVHNALEYGHRHAGVLEAAYDAELEGLLEIRDAIVVVPLAR